MLSEHAGCENDPGRPQDVWMGRTYKLSCMYPIYRLFRINAPGFYYVFAAGAVQPRAPFYMMPSSIKSAQGLFGSASRPNDSSPWYDGDIFPQRVASTTRIAALYDMLSCSLLGYRIVVSYCIVA